MMLFLMIWILLVAAAGGLAVGALWGRELEKGSCGHRAECGLAHISCEGCLSTTGAGRKVSNQTGDR